MRKVLIKQMTLRLDIDDWNYLETEAKEENISKQELVRELVAKYVRGEISLDDGYQYNGRYVDNDGRTWKAWRPWRV